MEMAILGWSYWEQPLHLKYSRQNPINLPVVKMLAAVFLYYHLWNALSVLSMKLFRNRWIDYATNMRPAPPTHIHTHDLVPIFFVCTFLIYFSVYVHVHYYVIV